MHDRIRIKHVKVLSDDWAILKKTTFDYLRKDGTWQTQNRETYDRGNGAVILLYNRTARTVVLIRQFRLPAYVNGHPEPLIEAPAGRLDADDPETCIRKETEEETGYRVSQPRRVFNAFMSPGSITERLVFFVAEYDPSDRIAAGGGDASEGEEIEVIEPTLEAALAMIERGDIIDAKTIMLLQYAQLKGLLAG
ncbi:NUDIX domain-containing protein [Vineibacter terrae]|uniref:NUDIX domain-containing protein n=1 Tax=Vineibacter terrae TaxID=2586908 RepID=UPI001E4BB1AB|nr:NUDIX domain-containing protein [Vineibacter terrae]HEX2886273.1 NUDIX domain-containing protein [Vineibacter terrae]